MIRSQSDVRTKIFIPYPTVRIRLVHNEIFFINETLQVFSENFFLIQLGKWQFPDGAKQ